MDMMFKDAIKFSTLDVICKDIIKDRKTLNIFIDFDEFFQTYKNATNNRIFQCCGPSAPKKFVSNVLNIMGHYRQWGVRKGLKTNVYGMITTERSGFENSLFFPDFRKYYVQKSSLSYTEVFYVNSCIGEAIPLISTITEHIDGVYMLDSHFTDPTVIPYFVEKEIRSADLNLIVSRNVINLQYVNFPNYGILFPYHMKGKDDIDASRCIGNSDELVAFLKGKDVVVHNDINDDIAALFLLCIGVCGDKHRSLPKLPGFGVATVVTKLESIAKHAGVSCTREKMATAFIEKFNQSSVSLDVLNTNMKVASVVTGYNNMSESSKTAIKSQIIDIPDYENLKMLNSMPEFFVNYPINLGFLTSNN